MFLNSLQEEKIEIRRHSYEMQLDIALTKKLWQKTRYNHLLLSGSFFGYSYSESTSLAAYQSTYEVLPL